MLDQLRIATAGLQLLLASAGLAGAQRHGNLVTLPDDPKAYPLYADLYGYSVEPVWVNDFVSTNLTSTLLRAITNVTGRPPPIRIGGNTADQTTLVADGVLNATAIAIPNASSATRLNVSSAWFRAWGDYFERGTNLTMCLNMRENDSDWLTARSEAETAWRELGADKHLVRFELGNELDHFINKGWRNDSWGVVNYAAEFRHLTGAIMGAQWFRDAGDRAPSFAAGSFADPPWVPDQHDELDDMDILNLTTRAGLVNEKRGGSGSDDEGALHIDSYVVHMYPMSTCDSERWHRMRLDLLSNHSVVWQNVSQYVPQVAAANGVGGAPLVMGETNSISCSGRSGISDTLGAALWNVDYTLSLAAVGFEHVYYHVGAQSEYSSFVPRDYTYKGERLSAGIRPGWYAHYFVAHVVRPDAQADPEAELGKAYEIAALPAANSSDLSGFGVYRVVSGPSRRELRKLVLLDMGVWNGTEGLGNPSTISSADNVDPAFHSAGERPVSNMTVETPWCEGADVRVLRLSGPGSNAKSGVEVSGVTFDPVKGGLQSGEPSYEVVSVGAGGAVEFGLRMAEGVLLELASVPGNMCGGESGAVDRDEETGGSTGAAASSRSVVAAIPTAAVALAFAVWMTL